MPRLSVLHAAKFYPPVSGGMETVVGDLCEGTSHEWDVKVVAASQGRSTVTERVGGVQVVRAATYGSVTSVPLCPTFAMHLWRQRVDCVVLHEPNPVAGAAWFLRTPARRLIVWHHSDLLRPWWAPHTYGRVQRALYRRADCVIVSSPNLAAASELVPRARRVVVVPFGIQIDRYRQSSARVEELRRAMPGPRVLFVGRFVYYKGLDVLIDAIARTAATLWLVGEGPLEPELRQRVRSRGIQERVRFIGRVSDEELPAYYQASDLFVLPSIAKTETFGVVQVEAMAAGLPVVSTNLPTGVPWVNQDGVTGLVVPPGDPDRLADAINRLIGDDALRGRFGGNAAARAQELFAHDRMIHAFRDLVEQLVLAPEATVAAGAEAS